MAVVLITGTSSGIGLATALHFARRGDQVYATMRDLERAGALREAAAAEGLILATRQLDVTDDASVRRAVGEVLDEVGRIDVLVNNAGVEGAITPVERTDDAMLEQVFNTNVFGVVRTIRAVLPSMRAQQSGCIVNVSSIAGRIAPAGLGPYPASKRALESLSETLALEVRPFGIRVAIIEPGVFPTVMVDRFVNATTVDPSSPYADAERRMHTIFVLGRQAEADLQQVAEAIEHAVTTDQPKLRYLVGEDAEVFWAGRNGVSDEEWVEFGRQMTDDEYWQEFARLFPMPAPV